MRTRWVPKVKPEDLRRTLRMIDVEGLTPIGKGILAVRSDSLGLKYNEFLNPREVPLKPVNLDLAYRFVEIVRRYGERTVIYGDYDVDGITSSVIMYKLLKALGIEAQIILPNRFRDGYGLNRYTADRLALKRPTLLITVDNGISAYDEICYLKAKGLKIIVIDHHQFERVPPADLVIHPDLTQIGDIGLTAGGITFKLAYVISQLYDLKLDLNELVILAAISTVADVAPLVGENRLLVVRGLEAMRYHSPHWLTALWEHSRRAGNPNSTFDIGYIIGPRLNAAGRMDDPKLALQLILEEDLNKLELIAGKLESLNSERRRYQEQVLKYLQRTGEGIYDDVIVFLPNDTELRKILHEGIIGIIAGRLAERYELPAFVLTYTPDGKTLKGSARTPHKLLSVVKALENLSDHLLTYGGHHKAGGFSLETQNFLKFRDGLLEHYAKLRSELNLEVEYDFELLSDMYPYLVQFINSDLKKLEPFGEGFPNPVIAIEAKTVSYSTSHLKAVTVNNQQLIELELNTLPQSLELFERYKIIVEVKGNPRGIIGEVKHIEKVTRRKLWLSTLTNDNNRCVPLKLLIINPYIANFTEQHLSEHPITRRELKFEDLSSLSRTEKYELLARSGKAILYFTSPSQLRYIVSELADMMSNDLEHLNFRVTCEGELGFDYIVYLETGRLSEVKVFKSEKFEVVSLSDLEDISTWLTYKLIVCGRTTLAKLRRFIGILDSVGLKVRNVVLLSKPYEL